MLRSWCNIVNQAEIYLFVEVFWTCPEYTKYSLCLQDSETKGSLESRSPRAEGSEARVPSFLRINERNFHVATVN